MRIIRRCLALILSASAVLTAGCGQSARAENEEGNEIDDEDEQEKNNNNGKIDKENTGKVTC